MKQKKDLPSAHFALTAGITVAIAGALDMLGEPPAAWHPVVWYGKLIRLLEGAFIGRYLGLSRRGRGRGGVGWGESETDPGSPSIPPGLEDSQISTLERWVGREPCADPLWAVSPLAQFLYGTAILILATPIAVLPTLGIHALAQRIQQGLTQRGHPCLGILSSALLQGISLKPFFALRMLADAGRSVRQALEQDDLLTARHALRSLVSRDCSLLTAELLAAAAIESLAENLSDSVVAPLFYYVLFGVPGSAAYRLFNTFDSMIGYHGRYEYLGKVAARLDDVLNFIPARLTALLIIALAPVFGGNRQAAWRIWRRDAHKTESPNAGHPMAAMAGALGIQLEKVDHYILGETECDFSDTSPHPQATHLRQAEQMVWRIGVGVIALTAVLTFFIRSSKWSK